MSETTEAGRTAPTTPILETRGLTKSFNQLVAVDHVDFRLPENQLRGVIGPNGAGKTTFFNLVSGALSPTSGTITFRGEDVTRLPAHRRAQRGIALSLQITSVFPEITVAENVLGALNATRDRLHPFRRIDAEGDEAVRAVLRRADLEDAAREEAGTLAHGDQKVLEIGMALATDPDLLLLDEPTAGLSAKETRDVKGLVESLRGDITIMLVEHDMDVVMDLVDRITVFHDGTILAEGTPAEIRANERVQDVYFGRGH